MDKFAEEMKNKWTTLGVVSALLTPMAYSPLMADSLEDSDVRDLVTIVVNFLKQSPVIAMQKRGESGVWLHNDGSESRRAAAEWLSVWGGSWGHRSRATYPASSSRRSSVKRPTNTLHQI